MTAFEPDTTAEPEAGGTRRVSTSLVAGAVVIAFLIACPCAVSAFIAGRVFVADSRVEYSRWVESSHRVAWSGEGRYGVAQVIGADGTPEILAWDRQSGRVRAASGYRLAAVERFAAVAWLVPVSQQELTERLDGEWGAVLVSAGGAFDSVPESLLAWQLDTDAPSEALPPEPAWARWPGPDAWSATAIVDPRRGAHPATLVIETTADPAADSTVALPADVSTFDPVGWSASGRYFALAEMIPSEPVEGNGLITRRLFVVDASEARVVTTATQQVTPESGPAPVWDEGRDLLLWVEPGEDTLAGSPSSLEPAVLGLVPGGTARPAQELLGAEEGPGAGLRAAGVHRSASDGVLLESGGRLVRWSSGKEIVELWGIPPDSTSAPVYHRDGGWLVLATEYEADRARSRDLLLHLAGEMGEWEAAWTGAWRDGEK